MVRLITLRSLESYFRHRWLYMLPVVVMSALAVIFVVRAKPNYIAEGVVHVSNQSLLTSLTATPGNSTNWWITPAQAVTGDIGELLQTDAFVRAVIHETKLEGLMNQGPDSEENTFQEVRKSIWVYPLGDNQISVHAMWGDPLISYQLVNAVIDGYLQWSVNGKRADSTVAQSFFADLIKEYAANLDQARQDMRAYLLQHPTPLRGVRTGEDQLEIDRLQSAINMAYTRYASALDKEEAARLAMAQIEGETRQSYMLMDAPQIPTQSTTSLRQRAMNIGVFELIGIILMVTAVAGSAVLDRSFRFPVDVAHQIDLPVLAIVPDVNERKPWYRRLFKKRKPKVLQPESTFVVKKEEPLPVQVIEADETEIISEKEEASIP